MTLGNALRAAARVRPHFFNSFYRRVRVFREAPRAMGAAATVDLTHACSLHCPFCIAAGVRDRAAMPLGTFRRVARALSGVERLTLLGGEPFLHPQIAAVSGLAFRAAREVEIFTNGLALGTEPTAAGARINERLGDSGSDRLTVVLSVDPEHAGQMKPGRLARAVECLLEAERQHVCRARFSITHPALPTGRYIDAATVRDAIAEVSPALGDLFVERLVTGEAQDAFYFNPVVCSRPGEGGGAAPAAELLRLEDLVFSPEIAVTFGPRAGAPMFSALASVWSTDPPGATRLGDALDPGAARAVLRLALGSGPGALAEHLAGRRRGGAGDTRRAAGARELDRRWLAAWDLARGDGDGEAQARLLRAHDSFRRILSWDGGASASRELAGRALEFVAAGIGERSLRWGGDEGGGRLEMAVFRELAGRSAAGSWTAGVLASWIGGLFRDARGGAALPVYAGERELLGRRTPLAPGETRGILRVHLPREPGFGARDELVVRPILVFHPGGRVELSFPGIAAAPAGTRAFARAAAPSLRRLLGLIAVGAGPVLASRVVRKLPPELRARLTADPAASDVRPALPGAGDLLAAFEECSFDRNRQRADEGNPELIALILRHAPERFPGAEVTSFAARAVPWLERAAHAGLSRTTKALLSGVEARGAVGRRLGRLVAAGDRRPS